MGRLAQERKVVEYWWHAAAVLPMKDFRFCLPRMNAYRAGQSHWFPRNRKVMREVLRRIQAEGPLKSIDFKKAGGRSGPWWDWKPAKIALELLFHEGKLLVSRRDGFQKVYDLPERVLPEGVDLRCPSAVEHAGFLARRTVGAHGLATESEITYLREQGTRPLIRRALAELVCAGELRAASVEGGEETYYIASAVRASPLGRRPLRLLCPFDNAVIQRRRLKTLFGFDYQIECYTPAAKRRYGYYCFPILWKGRFVGRLDPKADRKCGILHVRSLWLEPGFRAGDAFRSALEKELGRMAAFNGCERLRMPAATKTA